MASPATTPANEPASQPALARTPQLPPMSPSEIFRSAVTGNLASTTKSNAPLDPQSIASLAAGIVSQKPTVQTINASARSTHFQVLYAVDGAASGRVLVNIGHYTEAAAAQEVMRQYLSTFDADVSTVTRKPDKPLGQVSLLTGASVFWVRDAIWVRLQVVPPLGPQGKLLILSSPFRVISSHVTLLSFFFFITPCYPVCLDVGVYWFSSPTSLGQFPRRRRQSHSQRLARRRKTLLLVARALQLAQEVEHKAAPPPPLSHRRHHPPTQS